MVKVRILTGVTAATAAALAIPSLVGCTAGADEGVDTGSQADTESVAGSGELVLHSWSVDYRSTSGGDEFVRVGEKIKVSAAYDELVMLVAYADGALEQELRSDPSKMKVDLAITYTKFDGSTFQAPAVPLSFAPGAANILTGTSPEVVVPKGVKNLRMDLLAHFDRAGVPQTASVLDAHGIQRDFVVFGAFLPNKLALFDTAGAERRTRIVEGGSVVKGSKLELSVTDWRLDTVVDKTNLDLRVGQQYSGNRFGPAIVDALGALDYEVEAVVSTDGGATFHGVTLDKAMRPDVLARSDGFRFAMQQLVDVPADAGPSLQVAFHVKAFLVVPNYYPGQIMNAKYAPGQRVLLKDTWDNNGGQNYALPIGGN